MENFIFMSPDFPKNYQSFVVALKNNGFNVLGIGGTPYHELTQTLKDNLSEYYYCPDMNHYESLFRAVAFLSFKHGKIKYLESNNEYWLESDAKLRLDFNIEGLKPSDLAPIKHKSKMKEYYQKAGVKFADFALIHTVEEFDQFLACYGYPLFIKPDVGVGASDSYKISSDEDKNTFFQTKKEFTYIVEPFIEGLIISYDGIVNHQGKVIFATSHVFPVANDEIAKGRVDDYYYSTPIIDPDLKEMGNNVIEAFNLKGRNFHLEFFKSTVTTSFAKEGEYIGLEVNMRSPGGYIPDMICQAYQVDYYDLYAKMMSGQEVVLDDARKLFYGLEVSRRKEELANYFYTNEEIIKTYAQILVDAGLYPEVLAAGMGDYYFVGVFHDLEAALAFKNDVLKRKI